MRKTKQNIQPIQLEDQQMEEQDNDSDQEVIYVIQQESDEDDTQASNNEELTKKQNQFKWTKKARIAKRMYGNDMEFEIVEKKPEKKKKKKKKTTYNNQIDAHDITQIIIIILLVLILGVTLFRVILEVQVQYKNAEDLQKISKSNIQNTQRNNQGLNQQPGQLLQNINLNLNSDSTKGAQKRVDMSRVPTVPSEGLTLQQHKQASQKPAQIKIVLTPECQKHIDEILEKHGTLYEFRYPYKDFRLKSRVEAYQGAKGTQISRDQYAEAIQALQLVHTVNAHGDLLVDHSPCEGAQNKTRRLIKLMENQKRKLNQKYYIDIYHNRQLRFCLVVNSYNNAKKGLIYRNIDSIFMQDYQNYHVIYTDDHSTDNNGPRVMQYLQQLNIPSNKIQVILNQKKVGMMENIYNAMMNGCQLGQIVVMVDGDDSLIGRNVLSLLNAVYQKQRVALLWANFICVFSNSQASMGFSRDYNERQKKDNAFRQLKGLVSSHLKTFYVDVFRKIKVEDLQTNNGKFYGGASDTAMMIPMIQIANPRIKYLPQILYQYRYDTGQVGNTINRIPQKEALKKIFQSKRYEGLKDFSFINYALEKALILGQLPGQDQIPQKDKVPVPQVIPVQHDPFVQQQTTEQIQHQIQQLKQKMLVNQQQQSINKDQQNN